MSPQSTIPIQHVFVLKIHPGAVMSLKPAHRENRTYRKNRKMAFITSRMQMEWERRSSTATYFKNTPIPPAGYIAVKGIAFLLSRECIRF